jgi:hypothetical protein
MRCLPAQEPDELIQSWDEDLIVPHGRGWLANQREPIRAEEPISRLQFEQPGDELPLLSTERDV